MKTFVVYNRNGEEVCYIKARSHNLAEQKAKSKYGPLAMVSYTELGPEFNHCKGFFTDKDSKQYDIRGVNKR